MQDLAQFSMMRSFRRDASIQDTKLKSGTVRRIARFAAPYKRDLTVFMALIVVAAFVTVLNPLIFKKIIDDGIGTDPPATGDTRLVVGLALLVAGLALFDAVLQLWSRWCSTRIGEGLIYDMRAQVYTHISRMPIAFFTRTQTGALISRLNNDVLGAQSAFTGTLSGVVSNVIGVVLTLIAMLYLSWQITLLSLVLLPVFVIPAKLIGTRLQALTRESYALNAQMTNTMTERFNVSGALLVKLFGRPEVEEASFRDKAGRVRDIGITSAMYGRVFFVSLTTVAALATAMVYGVGGTLAANGSLGVGTVVALAAYLTRLYGPLTALSNVRVDVMTALVSFERVFEVLDLEPMVAEKPGAVDVPKGAVAVELDAVVVSYPTAEQVSLASLESVAKLDQTPSTVVLRGVRFRAEPGQLIALVGPSGAGKTTISQLVTRMYDVDGGSVEVGGHDVRDVTQQSLRDAV
ncbi:MAG: transporter related, partial [Frankiales bacterium]|nr:transporter related [Frankiales bacterium]